MKINFMHYVLCTPHHAKRLTLSFFLLCLGYGVSAQTYVWAKAIGGTNHDVSRAVVVDALGNVYTTGYFGGTVDFDPGVGVANLTCTGQWDIFISKLNASGDFIWAKSMRGNGFAEGTAIAVDTLGNVYTTGSFVGTVDFDPGMGVLELTSTRESADIFISKLNALGDFVWAKSMGGTSTDFSNAIAVDALGNVHTTGTFRETVDFDPGAGTTNLTEASGREDIFISKLNPLGDFVWAKKMGGDWADRSYAIAVDASGNVYTTGSFEVTADFDPDAGTATLTSVGLWDIFISKLNASGDFVWAKSMGGTLGEQGHAIAVDASGNVYTTGYFDVTVDFDPGAGTAALTAEGVQDIFICKLNTSGNFVWAKKMGGTSRDVSTDIAIDVSGNVYTTGYFEATADFDPGTRTVNLTSVGGHDIFVSKLNASGDFVWAKSMGGTLNDEGYGITLDASGNVYTTGYFNTAADFDPGTGVVNLTSAGILDIFISKLNDPTVGLESPALTSKNLKAYPNPVSDILTIETDLADDFQVINLLGQVVLQGQTNAKNIDVSSLPKGTYILNVGTENIKFLKQ